MVADTASANKAQLYSYFGSKEALFEAVFTAALHEVVELVPIDGTDLPGYAVRLYDDYLEHPELVRLATWSRLERRPSGYVTPDATPGFQDKLDAIADAQAAGLVDAGFEPFEVFASVIALSMTWSPASTTFAATSSDPEVEHDRRRHVLRTLVRRAYAPSAE